MKRVIAILVGFLSVAVSTPRSAAQGIGAEAKGVGMMESRDFAFGYWLNGWRKYAEDTSPDVLCIETGRYGFMLDVDDLRSARFGLFRDAVDYETSLAGGAQRMHALGAAELAIEVQMGGKVYRAVTCRAGTDTGGTRLRSVRIWESGRLVQHFDLLDLRFQDEAGQALGCNGALDLLAWPGSLTLTADVAPAPVYEDGPTVGLSGNGLCIIEKPLDIPHSPATDPETFTTECWVKIPESMGMGVYGWLLCKNANEWADGNYGFIFQRGKVGGVLNIGGGKENECRLKQRGQMSTDTWHHFALSYDGETMRFYVNGRENGSKAIGKARKPGTGLLRIGKRADGRFGTVGGVYDQIRVWSRALSGKEIAAHAKAPNELSSRQGLTFEKTFDHGPRVQPPVWTDAQLTVRLKGTSHNWQTQKRISGEWKAGEHQQITLTCNLPGAPITDETVAIQVTAPGDQAFPVAFDTGSNCLRAKVKDLKRTWQAGMTDIRDYDEFSLTISNAGETPSAVPFLLDLSGPANITGLCPVLCDENGVPTGIPVQLSKNWHYANLGAYLRAYALIPAPIGTSRYLLRIVYGFYGGLPSASHAQLSLIGYGGHGRWDQLAIGCWGETFCLDPDMSLTNRSITDARCLMVRNGATGKKWGWSDGGWGGDWLSVKNSQGNKLLFNEIKTAYLAHGPCLTDVRYRGYYGAGREVGLQARVHTLRTDDYARTFHRLSYRFHRTISADGASFFTMGGNSGFVTPMIAYGNEAGVLVEKQVSPDSKKGGLLVSRATLPGKGPWWVAFPGATNRDGRTWGTGSRALIIRSYHAVVGGTDCVSPTISMPVAHAHKDGSRTVDLYLVAPDGVAEFRPGDTMTLDAEWITLPRVADDYYGPNEAFRQHLTEHPRSWQTVCREAKGNDLKLRVTGGAVRHQYPIIIQATAAEPTVRIEGGVGVVPIRFDGLATPSYSLFETVDDRLVPLDQSVHGSDFWQTDYDTGTGTYRMTFNLPLDGKMSSLFVLRRTRN